MQIFLKYETASMLDIMSLKTYIPRQLTYRQVLCNPASILDQFNVIHIPQTLEYQSKFSLLYPSHDAMNLEYFGQYHILAMAAK
jgi:hypothetical protein